MGFFDRLFKGKEVFADKRNPGMVCEMTLCGQQHILNEFDVAYESNNSAKEYVEAYAVFAESVDAETERWITQGSRQESGLVKFYRNSDAMDEGALFEISFSDASCVRYRDVTHEGVTLKMIVMTFPNLKIGGEEFEIKK
ncbi:type VI secretion system tube protein TssD [Bacteroides sp.]